MVVVVVVVVVGGDGEGVGVGGWGCIALHEAVRADEPDALSTHRLLDLVVKASASWFRRHPWRFINERIFAIHPGSGGTHGVL